MNKRNCMMVGAVLLAGMALTIFDTHAEVADDIRLLMDTGEYGQAAELAQRAISEAEGERGLGTLYQLLGEARYYTPGERLESQLAFREARERGEADASLYLGRLAMLDYDFATAQRLFGEYAEKQRKARRPLDDNLAYDQADAAEGKRQFERMQEIAVIDAVKVPRKDFFRHLRIPLSAGRVIAGEELPLADKTRDRGPAAYVSESGDLMMWTQANDSTGMLGLVEANRLTDGTVSELREAPEFLGQEGDVINPFLSADGTTLYFCANGDNSVGGYDIFLATRDPQTGEYLQPVNAGIPFNSAADEYIMAIDEENGVGWWATDRHYLPDDEITLYVYVLPDERVNLEATDDEKRMRARLDDIRLTWYPPEPAGDADDEEEADEDGGGDDSEASPEYPAQETSAPDPAETARRYTALAAEIRKIQPGQKPRRHDCVIPLWGGRFIYSVDDVKTPEQRRLVEEYIAAEKKYEADRRRLDGMRRDYAEQTSRAASGEIARLEQQVEGERREITSILSQLYRLLK